MSDACKLFNAFYKGRNNFMTPTVISIKTVGHYAVELSSGIGMNGKIYGVTVLDFLTKDTTGLSQLFHSEGEAKEYITSLEEL